MGIDDAIIEIDSDYLFMRADPGLALTGRNCIPKRLINEGFKFDYSDLELTLNELVKN